jgi:hypothetical protein
MSKYPPFISLAQISFYLYLVSRSDSSASNHPGKYTLFRHDALAHLPADGTSGMAFLTDLSDFKDSLLPNGHAGTDGKRHQVYILGGQIFGEIPRAQLQPQSPHLFDAFHGQQAYLAVRAAIGVSIANQAEVSPQQTFPYVLLLGSLFFAFTDSDDSGHAYMTI